MFADTREWIFATFLVSVAFVLFALASTAVVMWP
jgi:hypothetical protein